MMTRCSFGLSAFLLAASLACAQVATPPPPAPAAVPAASPVAAAVPAPAPAATPVAAPAVATPAPQAAPVVTAAPSDGLPGKVSTSLLNIRARPGLSYEVIGKLKMNEPVQVVGVLDDWYCIRVPATVDAYVSGGFLDAAGLVNADLLKIRSGPGIMFNAYAMAKRGDVLKKSGPPTADGWQRIEAPACATAWVNKNFIVLAAPGAVVPPVKEFLVAIKSTDDVAADLAEAAGDQSEAATAAPKPSDLALKPAAAKDEKLAKDEKPAPAAPAKEEGQPAPATPAAPGTADAKEPATVTATLVASTLRDGMVSSLGEKATNAATHLLSTQAGGKLVPQCYLISGKLNLNEWDGKVVRVYGREIRYSSWRLPVIEVTGVQTLTP